MSAKNDGGPAFPPSVSSSASGYQSTGPNGMSLRDWFAGQALAGLMSAHTSDGQWAAPGGEDYAAKSAYAAADAMIAERAK